jgi:hypothetical protein
MPDETREQGTVRYIRCPSCGTPNPATALTCARCSKPMQTKEAAGPAQPVPPRATEQVVCAKCGKPLPSGSKFCGFCGAPLAAPAPVAPPPVVPKPPERQVAPTQAVPPLVPRKAAPPVPKPAAPPAPPLPPLLLRQLRLRLRRPSEAKALRSSRACTCPRSKPVSLS